MEKETRNRLQAATRRARALLEQELGEQLEGVYDIRLNGLISEQPGAHLSPAERLIRSKLVAAVEHHQGSGADRKAAVLAYLREAAFTTLNRFVALKMLEARGLILESVSRGDQSSGFREFTGLAPGLVDLPDGGYRLYLECLFDELGREVRVLFDRRDSASLLWPRRQALAELLAILNAADLATVWGEDETIGWVYQYFNGEDERRQMRAESQAPRNSRELAVRNQFFTPRYVVQFLTDNTLGRTWYEMRQGRTALAEQCEFLVKRADEVFLAPGEPISPTDSPLPRAAQESNRAGVGGDPAEPTLVLYRAPKDPRDLKILDPACGSGHFLLYTFDLLQTIYEEAWADQEWPASEQPDLRPLRQAYPDLQALRLAVPELILRHNLWGVDIDPRCAQIAALALWMRAQRAYQQLDVPRGARPRIAKTNIVVAEPMPGEPALRAEFLASLEDRKLRELVQRVFAHLELAGEAGSLLKIKEEIARDMTEVYGLKLVQGTLFSDEDEENWERIEWQLLDALKFYAERQQGASSYRRRLFAEDAARGFAFVDLCRQRYDVILMNPPFGACALPWKRDFERSYPRTKNDVYAAFVECGIQRLVSRGMLGAITSRTGFFLSSFQKWREEILLKEAPPTVVADLGYGVMDAAMVEAAAYCLEKVA
ncbi:MAG: DNA methyltransferase [Chloroflexota bacterium]